MDVLVVLETQNKTRWHSTQCILPLCRIKVSSVTTGKRQVHQPRFPRIVV